MSENKNRDVLTLQDYLDAQTLDADEIGIARFNRFKGVLHIYEIAEGDGDVESDVSPAHE